MHSAGDGEKNNIAPRYILYDQRPPPLRITATTGEFSGIM
jgi:hypothetical protein